MTDCGTSNREWLERFGYRPSSAPVCPYVVVGKRCRLDRHPHEKCLCQTFRALFDHGRTWRDKDGHLVVTGEPYAIHAPELARLVDAVDPLGIDVDLQGESLWNPGATILMTLTRRR